MGCEEQRGREGVLSMTTAVRGHLNARGTEEGMGRLRRGWGG